MLFSTTRHLGFIATLLCTVFTVAFAGTYTNPIKNPNGSDPHIVYTGGYFYLTSTTWTNIQVTRAATIAGLKTATPKVVWADSTASRAGNFWAPGKSQFL